jgi:hypothetical protein
MTSERHETLPQAWRRSSVAEREHERDGGPPLGLIVAGVVAIGLGYMAWSYLGPDLRRYLKIQNM